MSKNPFEEEEEEEETAVSSNKNPFENDNLDNNNLDKNLNRSSNLESSNFYQEPTSTLVSYGKCFFLLI
jgi:hypothetical protein